MNPEKQDRIARAILAEPKIRKAYPYGLTCPYSDCRGPVEDLFSEWTLDPNSVMRGQKATDCPYCERPVIFVEKYTPSYVKSLEVPQQGVPVIKRSRTKMTQWLLVGKTLLGHMQAYGMVRSDGKTAFEGYQFLP
jgi:hypothetical protein